MTRGSDGASAATPTPGRRVALAPDVAAAATENGLVLLDQRDGRYWQLNHTGARTLRLLCDGHSPEEAARRLTEGCPDAYARAVADVETLLHSLSEAGLVTSP